MTLNLGNTSFTSLNRYEYISEKNHVAFVTTGVAPYTATITIPHSLGYSPFFRTFFQFSGDPNYYAGFNGTSTIALGNWVINNLYADTSNLNISLTNLNNASSGTVYYRIYAESQT